MEHLPPGDWLDLISPESLNGEGAPIGSDELDLVRKALVVHMHDRPDITDDQSVGGQALSQRREVELSQGESRHSELLQAG